MMVWRRWFSIALSVIVAVAVHPDAVLRAQSSQGATRANVRLPDEVPAKPGRFE
jgi:hypothetical protein